MVKVTISVLVAEDHHVVRAGLCGLLEAPTDIAVVGEAENGREAVKLALELKPQVVLLDIGMPQLNGIDAARQIVADSPDTKIICLSMHREKHLVQAMLQAGANGYLLKTCAAKDLVEAIRAVAFGRAYLSSDIAGDIVSDHVRNNDNNQTCSSIYHKLSAREREVLQLLAEGKSTKEVAHSLFIGEKTVATHRLNIMKKLDLHTLAGLIHHAIREGLVTI